MQHKIKDIKKNQGHYTREITLFFWQGNGLEKTRKYKVVFAVRNSLLNNKKVIFVFHTLLSLSSLSLSMIDHLCKIQRMNSMINLQGQLRKLQFRNSCNCLMTLMLEWVLTMAADQTVQDNMELTE